MTTETRLSGLGCTSRKGHAFCWVILSWRLAGNDLEEEGVENGLSQRYKKFRVGAPGGGVGEGGPAGPPLAWRGTQGTSLWWACHATCSSKTRKSERGQGERLEQNLPARWQCPWEGGCPTGARPHLCAVPLMKPEAPSLGRGWPLGREQSGEHKQVAKAAMGLPQGAGPADAPLHPVTSPVTTQSHG